MLLGPYFLREREREPNAREGVVTQRHGRMHTKRREADAGVIPTAKRSN